MGDSLRTGAEIDLGSEHLKLVATWATKVALLVELFLHDLMAQNPQVEVGTTFVPSDNLHALRIDSKPPEGTTVWLGAIDHTTFHPFSSMAARSSAAPQVPSKGSPGVSCADTSRSSTSVMSSSAFGDGPTST